jgi:hypothetical protein
VPWRFPAAAARGQIIVAGVRKPAQKPKLPRNINGRFNSINGHNVAKLAVGRRTRDAPERDATSRTADVFDDDRLAKQWPHLFRHDAPDHIGRPRLAGMGRRS